MSGLPPVGDRGYPPVRAAVLPALLAAVVLAVLWTALGYPPTYGGDAQSYLAMAAHPGTGARPPFGYRVLVPWLVHLTGAGWRAFVVVSIVLLAVFSACMFLSVRGDRRRSWVVWSFAMLSPAVFYNTRNAYLVDPFLYATFGVVLVLLLRRRFLAAALVLTAAAAGKEVVLFAVPASAWTAWVWSRRREAALMVAGPLAVLALVRAVAPVRPAAHLTFQQNLDLVLRYHRSPPTDLALAVVIGLGPIAVLALGGWRAAEPVLRRWVWTIALPSVLSMVLVTDWYRVLSLTTVGTLPLLGRRSWSRSTLVVGLLAVAVTSGVGQSWVPPGVKLPAVGAACVATVVVVLRDHRRARAGSGRAERRPGRGDRWDGSAQSTAS